MGGGRWEPRRGRLMRWWGCHGGGEGGGRWEPRRAELSECQTGRYGNQCKQSCSATCGGDNSCDRINGACIQGCDPGYLGTTCGIQCPTGKYGLNCSESCSPNCRGADNACNHEDGTCTNGCEDGYRGDRCDTGR
ncbi:hypothetical protein RRG08_055838 [Elysia crispata]|uniref:Uncharacterized protein n=1 Tax=Elysia crispata TaxID=231223 RepID=A0AAE1AXT3_9GAST|nr:hypothetical protein RRG08_055838 [Elysia crispata]